MPESVMHRGQHLAASDEILCDFLDSWLSVSAEQCVPSYVVLGDG